MEKDNKFEVKAYPVFKVMSWVVLPVLFLVILFMLAVFAGSFNDYKEKGQAFIQSICFAAIIGLLIYAFYLILDTAHSYVIVDRQKKTLEIRKNFRVIIEMKLDELDAWSDRIRLGRHGANIKEIGLYYCGTKFLMRQSVFKNIDILEGFLTTYASNKRTKK